MPIGFRVIPGMLNGQDAGLVQRNVLQSLTRRVKLKLFLFFLALVLQLEAPCPMSGAAATAATVHGLCPPRPAETAIACWRLSVMGPNEPPPQSRERSSGGALG